MKIVKRVSPACDCRGKLATLAAEERASGTPLEIGSVVECECGKQYKLTDHQFDGPSWQWFHSDYGDVSKR